MGQERTEYLVLAPEARQGRNATDSEGGYKKCPEGDFEPVAQATHLAHILLAAQRVNDRARAQEEQGFEIGVRYQVQHPPAVVVRPLAHKHVAKLADG